MKRLHILTIILLDVLDVLVDHFPVLQCQKKIYVKLLDSLDSDVSKDRRKAIEIIPKLAPLCSDWLKINQQEMIYRKFEGPKSKDVALRTNEFRKLSGLMINSFEKNGVADQNEELQNMLGLFGKTFDHR